MTEADSEKPRNEKVSHLGDISFFRRGPTICVNNQLLPVELMDREAIAESLRSLADMVSSAPFCPECSFAADESRRGLLDRISNTGEEHAAECVIRITLSESRDKNSTPPNV